MKRIETYQVSLAEARQAGWDEGHTFEGALARRERQERENRLTRLAGGAEESVIGLAPRDSDDRVLALRRDLERLAAFHDAVLRSRAWIWVQRARRLLGRAW